MDFQQLDYFIECALYRSMRKVAQLRYCSVSLVSRHLSSLERELGVSLFRRSAQGLELTKEGEFFLIWALQSKESYNHMRENISPVRGPEPRCCHIVCCLFDDAYLQINRLLEFFPGQQENYSFRIHIVPVGQVISHILNRHYDAGVIGRDALKRFPDVFHVTHFSNNQYKLTVGHRHPLFGETSVCIDRLLREYSSADAYFLPGSLNKYKGSRFGSFSEIMQLTHDYMFEYVTNTHTRGKWIQTASDLESFNAEVTFGTKIAITAGPFSTINNKYLTSVPFTDEEMAEETVLFWRKDTSNDGLKHLLQNL